MGKMLARVKVDIFKRVILQVQFRGVFENKFKVVTSVTIYKSFKKII